MRKEITINDPNEEVLIKGLEAREDIKAERIKRLLSVPDLTKKENSPVKIINDQILELPRCTDFDIVDIPRMVTVQDDFDLLNTPKDHPSRRETDTYYLDEICFENPDDCYVVILFKRSRSFGKIGKGWRDRAVVSRNRLAKRRN